MNMELHPTVMHINGLVGDNLERGIVKNRQLSCYQNAKSPCSEKLNQTPRLIPLSVAVRCHLSTSFSCVTFKSRHSHIQARFFQMLTVVPSGKRLPYSVPAMLTVFASSKCLPSTLYIVHLTCISKSLLSLNLSLPESAWKCQKAPVVAGAKFLPTSQA